MKEAIFHIWNYVLFKVTTLRLNINAEYFNKNIKWKWNFYHGCRDEVTISEYETYV